MDRTLWQRSLSQELAPHWPCPACKTGTLALVPKSLTWRETEESRRAHGAEAWDPDWITYAFTGWLKCVNQKCGQQCVVSGIGGVEPDYDPDDGSATWIEYFAPRYLWPMPDVIRIPNKCPEDVTMSLRASFAVVWFDQKAAVNHIRSALERLLDHLGVQRRRKTSKGSLADLSLHARIELYQKAQPLLGTALMALKWVGNTGSHGDQIKLPDLLDAYEVLEHALEEAIEERSKRVAALAKKITQKHAKRSR